MTDDIIQVNHSELVEEIKDRYEIQLSSFIWGPPGIGKSYSMREAALELAKECGRLFVAWVGMYHEQRRKLIMGNPLTPAEDYEMLAYTMKIDTDVLKRGFPKQITYKDLFIFADLRLSQREAIDMMGLPDFDKEAGCTRYLPPGLMKMLSRPHVHGMLFLDEIPLAPPMVQNSAYQLIEDRACGDIRLSDTVSVVGAGNRMTDGGHQHEAGPALYNRFLHNELLVPNVEDWSEWASSNGVHPTIVGFLNFRPSLLMADMAKVRSDKLKAWPSPRTWAKASTAAAKHIKPSMRDKDYLRVYKAVGSAVGPAGAVEFRAFLKTARKLDLKEILDNPEQVADFDISLRWALISGVADMFAHDKKLLPKIIDMTDYLPKDFGTAMLKMLYAADKKGFSARLMKCKNSEKVYEIVEFLRNDED